MESRTIRENVGKAYNTIAERYFEWTETSHNTRLVYLKELLDIVQKQQREGRTASKTKKELHALELGCGAGVPCTQLLASVGNMTVTANDISSAQITLARNHLPKSDSVILVEGDMMDLGYPSDHFDVVVAMYSIFHLPRDDQKTMLQRISGWLKPGGYFLGNFAATSFECLEDENWLGATEGVMFWSSWSVEQTCEMFVRQGLEVLLKEVKNEIEDGKEIPFLWVMATK